MEENKENTGVIEGLALITDAMQTLFTEGKMICVYELDDYDFRKVQQNFRKIDSSHNRFSIDISGVEHVFINEKYNVSTPKQEGPKKKSMKEKLFSFFKSSGSSVK